MNAPLSGKDRVSAGAIVEHAIEWVLLQGKGRIRSVELYEVMKTMLGVEPELVKRVVTRERGGKGRLRRTKVGWGEEGYWEVWLEEHEPELHTVMEPPGMVDPFATEVC